MWILALCVAAFAGDEPRGVYLLGALPTQRPATVGHAASLSVTGALRLFDDPLRARTVDPELAYEGTRLTLVGEVQTPLRPLSVGGWGSVVLCDACVARVEGPGARLRFGRPEGGDAWRPLPGVVASGAAEVSLRYRDRVSTGGEGPAWEAALGGSGAAAWRRLVVAASVSAHRYVLREGWWNVDLETSTFAGLTFGEESVLGISLVTSNIGSTTWPLSSDAGALMLLPSYSTRGPKGTRFWIEAGALAHPGYPHAPYPWHSALTVGAFVQAGVGLRGKGARWSR